MKKCLSCGFALAAIAGLVFGAHAQDTTDQSQYPVILQQPVDQCLPAGASAAFSVVASNANSYQWYRNSTALDGETNSSVTISSLSTNDVGYYSASVMNGSEAVPTRMACLNVYVAVTSTLTSTLSSMKMSASQLLSLSPMDAGGGGTLIIYGAPVSSSGGSGSCPGKYAGYVNFTKTSSQGWGWAPSTNTTIHTASDGNRTDTKIQYGGMYGDGNCAQTTVTVPSPPMSPVYRFSIYFPTNSSVPTNAYPVTLTGFDP